MLEFKYRAEITDEYGNKFFVTYDNNVLPYESDKFFVDKKTGTIYFKNNKGEIFARMLKDGGIVADKLVGKMIDKMEEI